MKIIFKLVRPILGRLILLLNVLTRHRQVPPRDTAQQAQVDAQLKQIELYQFHMCPFCVKVRRAAYALRLNLTCRDAQAEGPYRQALAEQGGKVKVPCLRIADENGQVQWLYESNDIVAWLKERFG